MKTLLLAVVLLAPAGCMTPQQSAQTAAALNDFNQGFRAATPPPAPVYVPPPRITRCNPNALGGFNCTAY